MIYTQRRRKKIKYLQVRGAKLVAVIKADLALLQSLESVSDAEWEGAMVSIQEAMEEAFTRLGITKGGTDDSGRDIRERTSGVLAEGSVRTDEQGTLL